MLLQKLYAIKPNPAHKDAIDIVSFRGNTFINFPMIGLEIATVSALMVKSMEKDVVEKPSSVVTGVMNRVCMLLIMLKGKAINRKQATNIIYL